VSQAAADQNALVAATAAAKAALTCVAFYTSTQTYKATCQYVNFSITRTAVATSYVSQTDADDKAYAAAKLDADTALAATGQCNTSNSDTGIQIPSLGNASLYPWVKFIDGASGYLTRTITKVVVTVTGFWHTYPRDVSMLLVSPTGQKCLLMAHCGHGFSINSNAAITLVFDDAAGTSLPDDAALTSSTHKPTQYYATPAFSPPAPNFIGGYPILLSTFNGIHPGGTWALYVMDDAAENAGGIQSWHLDLTVV
jgi:hypothetical protein